MSDRRPRRPHTAAAFDFDAACYAPATRPQLAKRPGSQMSQRAADADAGSGSASPALIPIRRVPSSMQRSIEVQTDPSRSQQRQYQAYGVSTGQGTEALPDACLFQPQLLPANTYELQLQQQQQQQQQLPGFASLPVLDPEQLVLSPYGKVLRRPATAVPQSTYRYGRNGSCWRHVSQCIGNLGNNIVFIDGKVKEEDCRKYPPYGYPASTLGSGPTLSVCARLAPKAEPRCRGAYQSQALQRARSGVRYWIDDGRPRQLLVPNTIQGRIMKSGLAY